MFKKIKIKAVRWFYKVISPFRTAYWFIFRPKTRGAKCIVEFGGKILLVRLTYAHDKWTFPGGRVGRNETFDDGARREVKEEVGIKLDSIQKIGEYQGRKQYKRDTVFCYRGLAPNANFVIDELEIREAGWFDPKKLPVDHTSAVDLMMSMYFHHDRL